MAKNDSKADLIKQLIKQISGDLTEKDEPIPEVAIDGSGEMWCWDPITKIHKRIYRGLKAFIISLIVGSWIVYGLCDFEFTAITLLAWILALKLQNR